MSLRMFNHTANRFVFCAAAAFCLCVAAAAGVYAQTAKPGESAVELFESKVRPLLAGSCAKCHGAASASGGLRLDSLAALLKGGGRGPAIVRGRPDESLLLHAIEHTGAVPAMPPGDKLTSAQIAAVRLWIAQGAVWPGPTPQNSAAAELWSTRPIIKPPLPKVRQSAWPTNSIDYYVLARLETKGMTPAPTAGKRELLRRAAYDITGLPPTPAETSAFLADHSPNAYSKLVDRLLNSPRYGERWARHWLDLVRYADTNGYERDAEKPYSWKYRDWVIQSLNDDKPYNRFVTEQLAGDELPDRDRSAATVTATGFLRLGTWDDEPNDPVAYKYDRLDDLVHSTATAFLGLTVRCARCHDHKFDPISQKDYYAFAANFYGGYLEPGDGKLFGGPPTEKLGFPVLGFTDRNRTAPDLHLLQNGDARREQDVVPAGYLSLIRNFKPAEFLPVPVSNVPTTLRRTQLAAWITDERNPLTARVIVNRIWQHHFGRGIVSTPNNFGRKGALPTNPALLDWLAYTFVHQDHWSMKALHKRILMSSTYRMSSIHPAQAVYAKRDFLNENLWRFNRLRLDADELRDSMLFVGGDLNLKEFGPGFVPTVTREALEGLSRKGAEWAPSPPEEQRRRTIYMFLKRALIMPLLTVFDFADTTEPLEQRDVTTVAPQSLALLNNPFSNERSEAFARRVSAAGGSNRATQIQYAWQFAYGRRPDAWEAKQALDYLTGFAAAQTSAANSGSIGGWLTLRLRADRGVKTDSSGRVTDWSDPTHVGFSAIQEMESSRPLLVPGSVNGHAAIRFDGRSTYLNLAVAPLSSQEFTIIALVTDQDRSGGHRELFSNWNGYGNIGTSLFFGATGESGARLSDNFSPVGSIAQKDRPFIFTAVSSTSAVTVCQNRQEIAYRAAPLTPRNLTGPYVLGRQGNLNSEFWNGDVVELRVYNRALSDAEREQVWNEFSQEYGVAVPPDPVDPALVSLCHTLLNSNEFLYID